MKTSILALCSTFLMMIGLLFTGCKKDEYPHGPARCQVYKVKYHNHSVEMDSAVFTYNKNGDPIRITRGLNTTGAPDALFWYDKRGRLTDYIGIYSFGDSYEFRHRYSYDYKDRIITDTMYVFGFLSGYMGSISNIRKFKYDAQNRIIRMDYIIPYQQGSEWAHLYIYNQQGNIEKIMDANGYVVDTPVYDDKINMNNLHPIWQFLALDYSRNNPFGARGHDEQAVYNQYGLPVEIDKGFGEQGGFADIIYKRMTVQYQCR